jgi:hypothetical protein
MTTKTAKSRTIELPPSLAGIALIDAPTAAGVGCMSVSWWHEEVRAGRAPVPAIRKPRCTRWRVKDVADFWAALGTSGRSGMEAERETRLPAAQRERA